MLKRLLISFQGITRIRLPYQREEIGLFAAIQSSIELVIISGWNGVKFVVVAARTRHRQPHESPGDDIDLIIQGVMSRAEPLPHGQETQSRQGWILIRQPKGISCQLFHDKTIVGKILMEGIDDVITVGVGKGKSGETDRTPPMSVGIAGNVQPMPPPMLPILFGGQQIVHNFRPGI